MSKDGDFLHNTMPTIICLHCTKIFIILLNPVQLDLGQYLSKTNYKPEPVDQTRALTSSNKFHVSLNASTLQL